MKEGMSFMLIVLTLALFCTPCDGPTYFEQIMEKHLAKETKTK